MSPAANRVSKLDGPRLERTVPLTAASPEISNIYGSVLQVRRFAPADLPPETQLARVETFRKGTIPFSPRENGDSPQVIPAERTWNQPESEPRASSMRARVNLTELAARIAGGNLELRALEVELNNDAKCSADRLAPVVVKLSRLATRRNDCLLFYNLISERDRVTVGELESLRPVVLALERRISQARARAVGPSFSGADSERIAELRLLNEFSRTLAELTAVEE